MSYRKQLVEVKKYNHDRVQIRCANQRKSLTDLNAKYKNLIEENKQLRDLLKECKASVKLNSDITRGLEGKNSSNYQNLLSILSRINATLGESEEK